MSRALDRTHSISRRTLLSGVSSLNVSFFSQVATAKAASGRRVYYDVPLIPQQTSESCWAAAMAMIISWSEKRRVSPLEIAKICNRLEEYDAGLEPLDAGLFDQWGMTTEAPQTFTADGFMDLLEKFGPLWVAAKVTSPHVRVVTGFKFGTDPYAGLVSINDPWQAGLKVFSQANRGSVYTETYAEFATKYEALGFDDLKIKSNVLYPVYFAHLRRKPA